MGRFFGRSRVSAEPESSTDSNMDPETPYDDQVKAEENKNTTANKIKDFAKKKLEETKEDIAKFKGIIDIPIGLTDPKYDELWGTPQSFSEENFAQHFVAHRKWQNVFFTLLFWIVVIITCVLLYLVDPAATKKPYMYKNQPVSKDNVVFIGFCCVGSAVCIVLLIVLLLFLCTGCFICLTILFSFLALGAVIALTVIKGNLAARITLPIYCFIFPLLFCFKLCGKIRFSTCVLKSAVLLASKFPSTVILTLFVVILQAALNYAFEVGTVAVYYHDVSPWVYIWVILSYFFLTNTIKNFSYTVIAGVSSCWYFLNESPYMPRFPFWISFRHMIGPSFGPCALGGLLQGICDTINEVNDTSKTNPLFCIINCMCLCCKCIVTVLLLIVNRFALIYCAMFGVSTKDGVKRWFKQKSRKMVKQCIVATVIKATFDTYSWVSSSVCGAVASFFAARKYGVDSPEYVFSVIMGTFFGKQAVVFIGRSYYDNE